MVIYKKRGLVMWGMFKVVITTLTDDNEHEPLIHSKNVFLLRKEN